MEVIAMPNNKPPEKFIKDPSYRNSYPGKLVDVFYEANARLSADQYAQAADEARSKKDHIQAAYNSKKAAEYYDAAGDPERGNVQRSVVENDDYEQQQGRSKNNNGCCVIS